MQTGQENMLIATDESQSKSRPLVPLLTTTDEGSDGSAIIKNHPTKREVPVVNRVAQLAHLGR